MLKTGSAATPSEKSGTIQQTTQITQVKSKGKAVVDVDIKRKGEEKEPPVRPPKSYNKAESLNKKIPPPVPYKSHRAAKSPTPLQDTSSTPERPSRSVKKRDESPSSGKKGGFFKGLRSRSNSRERAQKAAEEKKDKESRSRSSSRERGKELKEKITSSLKSSGSRSNSLESPERKDKESEKKDKDKDKREREKRDKEKKDREKEVKDKDRKDKSKDKKDKDKEKKDKKDKRKYKRKENYQGEKLFDKTTVVTNVVLNEFRDKSPSVEDRIRKTLLRISTN